MLTIFRTSEEHCYCVYSQETPLYEERVSSAGPLQFRWNARRVSQARDEISYKLCIHTYPLLFRSIYI